MPLCAEPARRAASRQIASCHGTISAAQRGMHFALLLSQNKAFKTVQNRVDPEFCITFARGVLHYSSLDLERVIKKNASF
jgi:hypothetical protein